MTDSLYTMSRKQNKDKMGLQFVKTKNKNYATDLTSTSEHYLQMYTVRTFCFLLQLKTEKRIEVIFLNELFAHAFANVVYLI